MRKLFILLFLSAGWPVFSQVTDTVYHYYDRGQCWTVKENGSVGLVYASFYTVVKDYYDQTGLQHLEESRDQQRRDTVITIISTQKKYRCINGAYGDGYGIFDPNKTGVITAQNSKNKWALLDTLGNPLTDFQFEIALPVAQAFGVAAIKKDQYWALMNIYGKSTSFEYTFPLGEDGPNGEDPFTTLPFDGGLLYPEVAVKTIHGESVICIHLLKANQLVWINTLTMEEV